MEMLEDRRLLSALPNGTAIVVVEGNAPSTQPQWDQGQVVFDAEDPAAMGWSWQPILAELHGVLPSTPGYTSPQLLELAAKIDWGDGSSPVTEAPLVSFDDTFPIAGNHVYGRAGTFSVSVGYYHDTTLVAAGQEQVKVALTPPGDITLQLTTGQQFSGLVASVPDGGAPSAIDWGDGHKSQPTLVSVDGNIDRVFGQHVYAKPGIYDVTVIGSIVARAATGSPPLGMPNMIGPVGGATAVVSGDALPDDPPAGVHVSGEALQPVVCGDWNYFDDELGQLTGLTPQQVLPDVVINYGDGTTPETLPAGWADDHFTARPDSDHWFNNPGSYTITATFESGSTIYGTVTDTLTVTQNSPAGVTFSATAGQPFSGVIGGFESDTPWDMDDPHFAPFAADVNWGDGQYSQAIPITPLGNNQYQVSGAHTYASPGQYTVTISADYHTNQGPYSPPTARSTADVSAATISVAATAAPLTGQDQAMRKLADASTGPLPEVADESFEATLGTAAVPADGTTATVRWGDGTRPTAADLSTSNGQVVASGRHTYRRAGHYTAIVLFKRAGKVVARLRERFTILKASAARHS